MFDRVLNKAMYFASYAGVFTNDFKRIMLTEMHSELSQTSTRSFLRKKSTT